MADKSAGQRFKCITRGCISDDKDFSLVTLFEHHAYHLVEVGYTEHFEYKCENCKDCFFTSRIFMVYHKLNNPTHKISRTAPVDLGNISGNQRLRTAVNRINELLRKEFEPVGLGARGHARSRSRSNRTYAPGTPRSISRASSRGLRAGSPMSRIGTLAHLNGRIVHHDFSNDFANVTARRTDGSGSGSRMMQIQRANKLINDLTSSNMPDKWKEAALVDVFAPQHAHGYDVGNTYGNGGFNAPQGRGYMINNNDYSGRSRPGSPGGGFGKRRGVSPLRGMSPPRGGRFVSDSNRGRDGYRVGDGGERGFQRNSRDDFHGGRDGNRERGSFRGDGGNGGRGGDRGSFCGGRGRGDSGFSRFGNSAPSRRPEDSSRDRSRSPLGGNPEPKRNRSFSRSRSKSPQKSNRTPPQDTRKKQAVERRSYSRSPVSSP